MSLLIVGSLALDTIETPYGKKEYILGGSATFITTSARYFTNNDRLVGVVGYDFPEEEISFLKSRNVDISALEISKDMKTFHWHGVYHTDLNKRDIPFIYSFMDSFISNISNSSALAGQ